MHLRRLQPECARLAPSPRLRVRAKTWRAVVRTGHVGGTRRCRAEDFTSRRCPAALPSWAIATPRSTRPPFAAAAPTCTKGAAEDATTCPTRPTIRRCRESRARTALARPRSQEELLLRLRQLLRAAPVPASRPRARPPECPIGASSRSTITGALSLCPLPLRAWRGHPCGLHSAGDLVAVPR